MNMRFLAIGIAVSLCWGNPTWADTCPEPTNLDFEKLHWVQYHDNGSYERDQTTVAKGATQYLRDRIAQSNPAEKLAIVMDIDETSLSNYPDMLLMRFGGTLREVGTAQAKGTDPVIKPALELYNFAKSHHVAVFFITGRPPILEKATVKNLMDAGYRNWDGLVFKPADYKLRSVIPYKSSMRRDIESRGYKIVLSIGDQVSDLAGGYAEKGFKLPNPYYYLP